MEQMFNSVYRDVGRALPISLPHVTSAGVEESPKYRLNIDVSGFRPEDIKRILEYVGENFKIYNLTLFVSHSKFSFPKGSDLVHSS